MNKEAVVKQIVLVTDGQSNIGNNPIDVSKEAYERGIVVNTIGIMNQNQQEKPLDEIVGIARSGGGTYEYTYLDDLYKTMQSVTYKTVNSTIQDAVNKQLKEIIGQDLDSMEPESRSKILNYIDDFSDEIKLQTCILMDCSGSMANKIHVARHSILDLMTSLKSRRGKAEVAIIAYPGERGEATKVIYRFEEDEKKLEENLYAMKPKGGTPTAEAIQHAIKLIEDYNEMHINQELIEVDAMG
ncbi:MAG: VWA domain-containing protein [Clostridiaceae bacterium]|nr:VWA domain-containing protein [Clostridiaceae bacterium]